MPSTGEHRPDQPRLLPTPDGLFLTIPNAYWQPVGDGEAAVHHLTLTTPLFINGTGHHVGAALLKQNAKGEPTELCELANPEMEEDVMDGLQMIHAGKYQPTVIRGKPYVVYMTPFAD